MSDYENESGKLMKRLRSKASKKPKKGYISFVKYWDADTDEIITTWLGMPLTLECPILKTCQECGKCLR